MGWEDGKFPRADDPHDVGWLISYWRIVRCNSCTGDYRLESRQFDHLVRAATHEQAVRKFLDYVDQKRASGEGDSVKGLTLFLSRVENVVRISDHDGKVI